MVSKFRLVDYFLKGKGTSTMERVELLGALAKGPNVVT